MAGYLIEMSLDFIDLLADAFAFGFVSFLFVSFCWSLKLTPFLGVFFPEFFILMPLFSILYLSV